MSSCSTSFHDAIEPGFVRDWEDRESKLVASLSADTDEDGVIDYWDQCMSTPELVKVSAQGCPLDTNGNGLPDYQETSVKTTSLTTPVKVHQALPTAVIESPRAIDEPFDTGFEFKAHLYGFEFESEQINQNIQNELTALVQHFNEDKSLLAIELTGHTDSLGTASYNLALSMSRAKSVSTYFRARLRSDIEVMVRGVGELLPIADNTTAEGRALNRRVEIQTLNKK
tara:strand:- start:22307 stop:22987 length:681 start_codon:yes stop_codon:yes gene_type:complete